MIRQPISATASILLGSASIIIVLSGYTWLSHKQHTINPDDKSIPTWGQMYDGFKKITTPRPRSGDVWLAEDCSATGIRLFIGLGITVTIGIIVGILGCFSTVKAFISPVLSFTSLIPPTAIIAIFFAFIPIMAQIMPMTEEYNLYIAIVGFGLIPALAERIHLAIRDVPDEIIYKSYTLGASHLEVVLNIIFRQILPRIIDGVRAQFGPTMVYLIAAEMLCADQGFGFRIRLQSRQVNMDIVFPYIIVLAIFGFIMTSGAKYLQKWLCPWFVATKA